MRDYESCNRNLSNFYGYQPQYYEIRNLIFFLMARREFDKANKLF